MKIINESFAIGERYRGNVNGKTFTVINVLPAGTVITSNPYGGQYMLESTRVYFYNDDTQNVCNLPLETARRLLLTKLSPATPAELRQCYPPGTRVRLLHDMVDIICGKQNPRAPKAGDEGVITHVDDACQIHVSWDKGGSLCLIPGTDLFQIR